METVFRIPESSIPISSILESTILAKQLTCFVLQASQMLAMLSAELARVLKIKCAELGQLTSAQVTLQAHSTAWYCAQHFIRFYNLIYDKFDGNAVAMRHWLRSENVKLGGVPLLLIIDHGRLEELIHRIENNQAC
ncbi:hypothetical protein JYT31_02865 [Beggiatoa alba]|nr:hypothetical protein [Beggiatoa alba]